MKASRAERMRIAFIKFGGLSAGGTERWLQMMAAALPRDRFDVTYFFTESAPYIGADYKHPGTDPARREFMRANDVKLIEIGVGAKDVTVPTHDWRDTDFWELFDPREFDLVQCGKAGPAEYPFHRLKIPIVEYLTLDGGVDRTPNIAFSIHLSEWQRQRWVEKGGRREASAVLPIPAEESASRDDLRAELAIPSGAVVAGFHQRAAEEIFSPIPLQAFARVAGAGNYFVLMGGAAAYRKQAAELGLANVRFVEHAGDAKRISAFLNTLDVFAHGRSDGETFGTVFAEAMMHQKPCLSHSSLIANGHVETIGPAGFIVDGVDEYARYLHLLLGNAPLRAFLGQSGRRRAEARYAIGPCVRALADIYERVAKGPLADNILLLQPVGWRNRARKWVRAPIPRSVRSAIRAILN